MSKRRKHRVQQSHKRPDIPPKQRSRGRIVWAILFGVFGLALSFFAADNYFVIVAGAAIGALIGYAVGKNIEQTAS